MPSQAYDGAETMQGNRNGVAKTDVLAAVPVHCLAHCLNLCLQDAGRNRSHLRDEIDMVTIYSRKIVKLVNFSPKTFVFREIVGTRPLPNSLDGKNGSNGGCAEALCRDYGNHGGNSSNYMRDDYGLKALGILASLEKFDGFFSLKLGYLLFSPSEPTSTVLQAKSTTAMSAINVTKEFYKRQRTP